jgi:hypothetical protein
MPYIPTVVVGGIYSTVNLTDESDAGRVSRPEFMVTSRRFRDDPVNNTTRVWEHCSSDDANSCWIGVGTSSGDWSGIAGSLNNSTYDKVAMESVISCDGSDYIELFAYCGNSGPRIAPSSNTNVRVYYNGADINFELGTGCIRSNFLNVRQGGSNWTSKVQIPVSSSDDYPVLRIELYKKDASDSSAATAELQVSLRKVDLGFDTCMKEKTRHGVCLKSVGIGLPLRSSHSLQKDCLTRTNTNMGGCTAWLDCLNGTETSTMLLKILNGIDRRPVGNLMETYKTRKTARASVGCNSDNSTAPGNYLADCVDPYTFDVEAFDCNCYDVIQNMTEVGFWEWTCNNSRVCCSWKESHCDSSYYESSSLLDQRRTEDIAIKSALDDSLTEKCR